MKTSDLLPLLDDLRDAIADQREDPRHVSPAIKPLLALLLALDGNQNDSGNVVTELLESITLFQAGDRDIFELLDQ